MGSSVYAAEGNVETYTPAQGETQTVTSPITDKADAPVTLVQNGAGTTILSAVNSYTGNTNIEQGTLALSGEGSIAHSSGVAMSGGSTFDISQAQGPVNITSLGGDWGSTAGTTVDIGANTLNITSTDATIQTNVKGNGGTLVISGTKEGFGGNIEGNISLIAKAKYVDVYNGASYTGETRVQNGGSLNVYGNITGTSHVTVESGGLLQGTGSIGSAGHDIDVESGGTIAPAIPGNPRSYLTVTGNLNMNGNSSFLNIGDNGSGKQGSGVINVTENLNLNGTIYVAPLQTQLGSGIRTLYNYGGNLNIGQNTVLAVNGEGARPDLSALQTGQHQVNFIQTNAEDKLTFWDGSHVSSTGQVEGGDGVWKQGEGAPTNWTTIQGTNNAAWNENSYAIFEHNGGNITVDGTVKVAGMQFAPEGNGQGGSQSTYHVLSKGDDSLIVLNGNQYNNNIFSITNQGSVSDEQKTGLLFNKTGSASIIRVGNGTSFGDGQTAIIDTNITDDPNNSTTLVKTDTGTLILNGNNSYTGGTAINNGILQIASDQSLGQQGTSIDIDGGILKLGADITNEVGRTIILGPSNHSGHNENTYGGYRYGIDLNGHTYDTNAPIIGPGSIFISNSNDGNSVINLNKDNTYTGDTYIVGPGTWRTPNVTVNANDATPFGLSDATTQGGNVFISNSTVNMNGVPSDGGQASATLGHHTVTVDGGYLNLYNKSTADSANIFNKANYGHDSQVNFYNNTGAGHASISNIYNASLNFYDNSSAENSTIINKGTNITTFHNNSTAGNATISNDEDNSTLTFTDNSTAGSSTIKNAGNLSFSNNTTADTASVVNQQRGKIDISKMDTNGLSIGSLSGEGGTVSLGGKTLTLGGLNKNDVLGAVIKDGGASNDTGGSLVKIGTGTQTLTGANTYTGHTIIENGTLALAGSGSIAPSSYVDVKKEAQFDISQASSTPLSVTDLRGDGTVALGGNSLTLTDADSQNDYNGTIAGSGGLTIAAGTKTLTGQNSFTGATTVAKGAGLNVNGGALAGVLANSGTSSVTNGAHVASVTNDGSMTVDKATVQGTLTNDGNFTVGTDGAQLGSLAGKGDGTLEGGLTLTNAKDSYSGSLSGTAGVNITGGTETLTGQNRFTGATSVAKGAGLDLNSGTLAGTLVNDGTSNLTNGATVASATNNGSMTLNKAIIQGRLINNNDLTVAGDSQAQSLSGAGRGTLNGILTLTNAQDMYSGSLSGNGGIVVAKGHEVLTGMNDYSGPTMVPDGATLEVNGATGNGLLTVQQDGLLRGVGSVGETHVESGGVIAPGISTQSGLGTLHVTGDVSMAKGSILRINGTSDVTGQSLTTAKGDGYNELTSDRLAVTGKANLAGGTLDLIVKNAGEGLAYGEAYRVLTATQGVSGQFSGLTTNLAAQYAYLDPTLAYSADAVDIVLKRNSTGFGDIGGTRNEVTAGQGVSHVGTGSGLVTALTGLTKDQARRALDNLSGELHASIRTALIQDSFYLRNAVINRLANADCDYGRNGQSVYDLKTHQKNGACYSDHAVLWGQAYGGLGHNSGDGNAALMHHNTAGFIVGADAPINHSHWRVGGLLSYGHSQFNVERGRSSSGNSNNISVGAYAGTHWGRLNLRLGADYSWNVINTRRQIAVGDYGSRVRSSYLGGTAQAYAELGYKLRAGRTVVEPFMNVAYVNMQTNSFREHGNDAALRSRGTDQGVTFSTFGFRAATRLNIGKAVFMPHIMGAYRHGFGRLRPGLHEGFVAGGGTNTMDVAGVLLSSNAAVTDAGITAKVTDRVGVDLSYIGQYGNHSIESGATGSVNVSF
ncbi:autotransporter domain-containing protein [Bombella saccharophila]|uniref:Autotransporter domain-containing protein n=1 Tax=Bombella saccharophila TaxID=2967338 RepID=A0ABT3W4L2_9PROT|nr:autotransporter domain-containing protein [Bombella saccharophila]MCX5613718.1 autotransporter domain-containing protein [Bombella saccharophila]